MPCRVIGNTIICGPKVATRECRWCNKPGTKLCDRPVTVWAWEVRSLTGTQLCSSAMWLTKAQAENKVANDRRADHASEVRRGRLLRKGTCDAPICDAHATSGGLNIDYCPDHRSMKIADTPNESINGL